MTELCTDIGFVSANKYGEQLCGNNHCNTECADHDQALSEQSL